MFNEVLTRKASVEPPPITAQSGPDDETRTCGQCSRPFVVKANARNVICALCFVKNAEDEQRANAPFEAAAWKRKQRDQLWRSLGLALLVALALAGLFFGRSRFSRMMGDEKRYDQWRESQGYKSTGY